MKTIGEEAFLKMAAQFEIIPGEDSQLVYASQREILGFDFSNMTAASLESISHDLIDKGDRTIERALVRTLFHIIGALELFPVFLYAVDNEWLDEDAKSLLEAGHILEEEARVLEAVMDLEGGMNALMLDKEEMEDGVNIIAPQMTLFSNRCAATNTDGKFLATFSEDDEVSFNTTDEGIYQAAREIALSIREDVPFDIIFAEDYS